MAVHMMEVKRILQAMQVHEEAAQEEARKVAENSRSLQAELQAKLQEMTATYAAAMQALTE